MKCFTLEAKNISKITDRKLIDHLDFCACSGKIHAIIGNNGEGKTVFAQILAGIRSKSSGHIFLDGKEIQITDTASAQKNGIYMLQQEIQIFPHISVRDNLTMGSEKQLWGARFFAPSSKKMDAYCREVLSAFGVSLDPRQPAGSLDDSQRRMLQLLQFLIRKPRVLLLDEFTTFLNHSETEHTFRILQDLKAQNVAVILITHQYSEICAYCDNVSVMTGGAIAANYAREQFGDNAFIRQISNLNMNFQYPRLPLNPGGQTFLFDTVNTNLLKGISFSLRQREIIGVAGLTKPQKKAFCKFIMSRSNSVSLVPEKDGDEVLFMSQNIPFNIVASNFKKTCRYGVISTGKTRIYAKSYMKRLGFRNADINTKPRHLSSGNKQKLIIARSLFNDSAVYIYDEPTKNLDATSRLEFYNILNALALKNASILMMSSDISELIGMCSRILLFKDGTQIGNYSTNYLSSETVYKKL